MVCNGARTENINAKGVNRRLNRMHESQRLLQSSNVVRRNYRKNIKICYKWR